MNKTRGRNEWAQIYAEYVAGKSVAVLAQALGTHVQTLYSGFSRWNLPRVVGRVSREADSKYFEQFRSSTEAYAFGLWLADGSTGKCTWTIKLHIQDKSVLQAVSDHFYSTPRSLRYEGNAVSFIGYSKRVAERLRYRYRGNKTATLRVDFSQIPQEFRPAVLRGIFDGDGCVSLRSDRPNQRQVSICSISKAFLEDIARWLQNEHGINTVFTLEKRAGKMMRNPSGYARAKYDMHRLVFGTHSDRVKLFELMYVSSTGPRIVRKYEEFKKYYENAVQLLACKKPALPDASVHTLYAQHTQGRSIRDIGRELGRDGTTVARWFHRHGLEVRSRVTHRD